MHSSWSDSFPFSTEQLLGKQLSNKLFGVLNHFVFRYSQQAQCFLKVVKRANQNSHCQARTDAFDQGISGRIIVVPPQSPPIFEAARKKGGPPQHHHNIQLNLTYEFLCNQSFSIWLSRLQALDPTTPRSHHQKCPQPPPPGQHAQLPMNRQKIQDGSSLAAGYQLLGLALTQGLLCTATEVFEVSPVVYRLARAKGHAFCTNLKQMASCKNPQAYLSNP